MAAVKRLTASWVGNDRGLLGTNGRVHERVEGDGRQAVGVRTSSSRAGQPSARRNGTTTCHD